MKSFQFIISLFLFSMLVFATSCGSKPEVAATGLEYTGAYVCPMHCTGSGSQTAGKCPICKMDYIPLATHKADGHQHEAEPKPAESHDGHNHGSHEGHDHGSHEGHEH